MVYDFDIPASRLIVPDGWADPYKVESATTYSGDGGTEFIKNVNRYFYTDLSSDGVGAVREEEGLTYDGRTVSVMDSSARISVYDLEGRLVAEGESSVDTGRLSRGVYVAEAVVSGRHAVMKIVVR